MDATPQHRCQIPTLPNDTFHPANPSHLALINAHFPSNITTTNTNCYITLNETTVKCDHWVYSDEHYTRTIVTEWDLVCGNLAQRGLFKSLHFAGTFGVVLTGVLADKYGRKLVLSTCVTLTAVFFISQSLVVNFLSDYRNTQKVLFGLSRFLIGFTSNLYSLSTVLILELVGPRYRVAAANTMNYFFILAEFIVLVFGYFVRDFRQFTVCMSGKVLNRVILK